MVCDLPTAIRLTLNRRHPTIHRHPQTGRGVITERQRCMKRCGAGRGGGGIGSNLGPPKVQRPQKERDVGRQNWLGAGDTMSPLPRHRHGSVRGPEASHPPKKKFHSAKQRCDNCRLTTEYPGTPAINLYLSAMGS